MPVRALTPLGQIGKWIVVPGLLLAAGYYVLGPRMNDLMPSLKSKSPAQTPPEFTTPKRTVQTEEPPVPEVEVRTKPAGSIRLENEAPVERPRKRRKRSNPVPIQTEAEKRPDEKKPAPVTGEGPSSEDPNAVDPAKKPAEKQPEPPPLDPGGSAGGTGGGLG